MTPELKRFALHPKDVESRSANRMPQVSLVPRTTTGVRQNVGSLMPPEKRSAAQLAAAATASQ